MTDTILSPPVVIDTCLKACKAMKLMSKQLILFSSIYAKTPMSINDKDLPEIFTEIVKNIDNIQSLITKIGKTTELSIGKESEIEFPENVVVTHKEYAILYKIFMEFTEEE